MIIDLKYISYLPKCCVPNLCCCMYTMVSRARQLVAYILFVIWFLFLQLLEIFRNEHFPLKLQTLFIYLNTDCLIRVWVFPFNIFKTCLNLTGHKKYYLAINGLSKTTLKYSRTFTELCEKQLSHINPFSPLGIRCPCVLHLALIESKESYTIFMGFLFFRSACCVYSRL